MSIRHEKSEGPPLDKVVSWGGWRTAIGRNRFRFNYDVVRIALGVLLLVSAGLKGYQLATEPVLGTGLLDSR